MGSRFDDCVMSYEQEVEKAIKEQPYDIEKIRMKQGGQHIFCSAHSPNEQLMFLLDPEDNQVKILTCMRPHRRFFHRLKVAVGYLFTYWFPYDGDWNMFIFNKDDAERLIAFLKKV